MMDHLGRGLGIVLIAMAAVLGACPAASAQRDVDRVLKEALNDWNEGSAALRAKALEDLATLEGDAAPAVPSLIAGLRDPSPAIRARAAGILRFIGTGTDESLPVLASMLKDQEATVREAAGWALAHQGRKAAGTIDGLVQSLRAPRDHRCPSAAIALASIGKPALPALIELLHADDPAIRRAVFEGLKEAADSGLWRQDGAVGHALEPLYQSVARDADRSVRIALARMLIVTRSDSPPVLLALAVLLRDPDAEVRLAVATALEENGRLPTGLRVSFLELLRDGESRVRMAAAKAVPDESLASAVVIERLLGTLKDADDDVRAAAAQKLASARYTTPATDEQDRVILFMHTSAALARHPAAGRILLSALDDAHPKVRAAAAHLLPVFPSEARASIPRLIERLKDSDPAVRASAAEALEAFGPDAKGAVRPLLALLANPDGGTPEGRLASFNAAKALAAIGRDAKAKMLRLLIGQLNSLEDGVRERAEQIVVALHTRVIGDLFRTLSDPRSPRRVQVEAQGLLHTLLLAGQSKQVFNANPPRPEALAAMPVMRSLSRDADPEVQIAALALLAATDPGIADAPDLYLAHVRAGADPDLDDQWIAQVLRPAMIPALIKGLGDQDDKVRIATAKALSALAESLSGTEQEDEADGGKSEPARARAREGRQRLKVQAAHALLTSLNDPDDHVRWIAAKTLGVLHVEAETVIPALIRMARTEKGRVRPDDISLRSFEEEGQRYALGCNDKGDDPLRIAAIQALAGFGRQAAGAVPDLVRALRGEDLRVRWFAAEAVGLIGSDAKTVVPALVEALRSRDVATGEGGDGPIRLIAAFALGKIGPEARAAIPELIAALSGPDSRVRGEAARALGLIGPEARAAVPELIRLATRGTLTEVAERAGESLRRLGSIAVPTLIERLHNGDPKVRTTALKILGQMDSKTAVPIPELVRCLRDRDADVREAAATALASAGGRPGAVAAILPLIFALWDQDEGVSGAARNALAVLGKPVPPAVLALWNSAAAHSIVPIEEFESVVIPLEP